jgi:hypothetical protein
MRDERARRFRDRARARRPLDAKEVVMKKTFAAVACFVWLTPSCSGRDVDLGNGAGTVRGPGTSATTGSETTGNGTTTSETTGMTTGSETTGSPGTTAVATGVTTGGSGGGSGTTGGTGGSAGMGSGGSSGVGEPASAIVIRFADIPPVDPGAGTSGTSGTGGNPIDPDTRYVIIGNNGATCHDPMGSVACGTWRVSIAVPPALFQPGILRLDDSRLVSVESVRGPDRGGGDCWGGGGSFMDGTLEIVDIGSIVHVRLANTSKLDVAADGSYAATNCP